MASPIGTNNVWPYYASGNTSAPRGQDGNVLGKDQFLRILITQLQNQDPMQPLQDREFIAQMAQFSSLEQMMNMGTELKLLRQSLGISSGMIGMNISWTTYDAQGRPAGTSAGIVEAIVMRGGEQLAKVGNEEVAFEHITRIELPTVLPPAEEPAEKLPEQSAEEPAP